MTKIVTLFTPLTVSTDTDAGADVTILFANADGLMANAAAQVGTAAGKMATFLSAIRFDAAKAETALWGSGFGAALVVGLPKSKQTEADLKALGAKLAKQLNDKGFTSAHVVFEKFGLCCKKGLRAFLMGANEALYTFDDFRTKKSTRSLTNLVVSGLHVKGKAVETVVARASAESVGNAFQRRLIDLPPNVLGTAALVNAAVMLGAQYPELKVNVIEQDELQTLGFGALLAVGRGSVQKSYVVTVRYEGNADAPLTALVGKGLVFDTGGVNLKTNGGVGMKGDMGGAALVLAQMLTLALTKAPVNVIGVIGVVENALGGDSYRPDDVLTAYNGKTIEITNTDAEGRLVLADCLAWTEATFKPAVMIDFATLTGAILVALGTTNAGLFTRNDALAEKLLGASAATGEGLWRLPMPGSVGASKVADMVNSDSSRRDGSATAALFLHEFVKSTPFAHIDIAGVSNPNSPAYGTSLILAYLLGNAGGCAH